MPSDVQTRLPKSSKKREVAILGDDSIYDNNENEALEVLDNYDSLPCVQNNDHTPKVHSLEKDTPLANLESKMDESAL